MAYPIDPSSRGGKGYHRYIRIKKVNKQFVRAGCGTRPSREGRAEGGVRSGPLLISAAASPYRHVVTSAACACSRGAVLCRSRVSHRGQLTPSLPAAVCARERRRAATSQEQQPLSSSLHASNGKASCQAGRAVQEAGTAKCSELDFCNVTQRSHHRVLHSSPDLVRAPT